GETYHVIDKCEYSVQVSGDWYLDSNWLYFGDANLYGELNRTSDAQVSMEVSNLKEYQVVHVTLDHPESDGVDET
ncbi:MAG: hypothetical protein GWN18_16200, partial [Thermoplasmata archaeon]|nr:hypothetical protein [Thermoplasmata archaeon]NIS13616.1 hypothetical protein [Thermoplasmata archaeon]NIS21485.1 hypothetical protein [Thermoplasmata archaeon]NIT79049.1 hypothetical protein [Thermoplasmata archaeon]NIU50534.1 hypothetical protein [Thermoplasmata archaeon]